MRIGIGASEETDGYAAGQLFKVSGSGVNDGIYMIQAVTASTITISPSLTM